MSLASVLVAVALLPWSAPRQEKAEDAGARRALILQGHRAAATRAVFSPDGARVLTAGYDGTARIWDAASGKQLAVLDSSRSSKPGDRAARETPWVSDAAFSGDGARVATCNLLDTAQAAWIWDASTGEKLAKLTGHQGQLWCLTFTPDGTHVITGADDGTARVWDATGKELTRLQSAYKTVRSLSFDPGGKQLMMISQRDRGGVGAVQLIDATTWKESLRMEFEVGVFVAAWTARGPLALTNDTQEPGYGLEVWLWNDL